MERLMESLGKGFRVPGVFAGAILGGLLALGAAPASAEWTAPEEERQVLNPVERTAVSVEAGHKLYRENCETCHGLAGMGDGPGARVLEARLPNLQDTEWASAHTDGEWFYKISVGKDPMVGYEDFLEEEEIWDVVNYVRSLSVAQADAAAPPAGTDEAPAADEEAPTEETHEEDAPVEEHAAESGEEHAGHGEEAEGHGGEAATETHAEGDDAAHGEHVSDDVHPEGAEHEDDDHHAAAAGHGGHGGADHGGAARPAPPANFDPTALSNYESTHAKAPLVWALILPVIIGGIFVAFQKMVPPPVPEPAAGGHGHGDDHGH
jgi:mono/diheme cytochrome c family protein